MPGDVILMGQVASRTEFLVIACRACPRHAQAAASGTSTWQGGRWMDSEHRMLRFPRARPVFASRTSWMLAALPLNPRIIAVQSCHLSTENGAFPLLLSALFHRM